MDFDFFLGALPPEARGQVGGFWQPSSNPNNPYRNINPNAYNFMDQRDAPADRLYADIIRAQTADYMNRFAPVETQLANEITATGTRQLPEDLRRTRGAVTATAENMRGQQARQAQRYGTNFNPDMVADNSTVSALVGGLNDTRLRDTDRRTALLTGGLGAIGQQARGRSQ